MTMMYAPGPGDVVSLVGEFAEPVPRVLRDRFFRRVDALLRDDETPHQPGARDGNMPEGSDRTHDRARDRLASLEFLNAPIQAVRR